MRIMHNLKVHKDVNKDMIIMHELKVHTDVNKDMIIKHNLKVHKDVNKDMTIEHNLKVHIYLYIYVSIYEIKIHPDPIDMYMKLRSIQTL